MIRVRQVTRRYGERTALEGVSLDVSPGETVGLLGPNGAGKSTLMRICAGLQVPDSGSIEIAGFDLWARPVEARARLGYMPDEPEFYEELSANELLSFLAAVHGLPPAEAKARAADLLDRLGLGPRAGEPVERYSHGMRKKLSFAAAALHRPRVLLCDEALEGFDLEASLAARDELAALARANTAIILSSHVASQLERLCDRIVMLYGGRVVRALVRADWGGTPGGPSALERAFLDIVRSPTHSESS